MSAEYPQAWRPAENSARNGNDDTDEDDSDGSDEESEDDNKSDGRHTEFAAPQPSSSSFVPNTRLRRLFEHISLACSGHPELYPTIILLLATVPADVLPPTYDAISPLFEAFWCAWGGRALSGFSASGVDSHSPTEEFVKALLECLVYETTVLLQASEERRSELVAEWTRRVLSTFLGLEDDGSRRHQSVATPAVAREISATLTKFQVKDEKPFDAAWNAVRNATSLAVARPAPADLSASLSALSLLLGALVESSSPALQEAGKTLAMESVKSAANRIEQGNSVTKELLEFLRQNRTLLNEDIEAQQVSRKSLSFSHFC